MLEMPLQECMTSEPALGEQPSEDPDVDNAGPCLSKCLFCVCCWNPLAWAASCTRVDQNQWRAVLYWGKYSGTLKEPGMYCINPCGREFRVASAKWNPLELKDIKVVDARGNPVIISGVVTYRIVSAEKACMNVENPHYFVRLQATTALKQVSSRFPYSAPPGQASLQSECSGISTELVRLLQSKTSIAGAFIMNFELVDLSYAPEIAQVMLVKQQAEALVEARRLIVGSAVDMAQNAVAQLEAKGTGLSEQATERITSTLLAVICSHSAAMPTIPVQG